MGRLLHMATALLGSTSMGSSGPMIGDPDPLHNPAAPRRRARGRGPLASGTRRRTRKAAKARRRMVRESRRRNRTR